MSLELRSLRELIADELLNLCAQGILKPGEPLHEGRLAAQLGVSRTPLREALVALESDGILRSEHGKGFRFVKPHPTVYLECAAVLAALEGLVFELIPLGELRHLGRRLTEAPGDDWHDVVIDRCPNRRLVDLIRGCQRAMRYHQRVSGAAGGPPGNRADIEERLLAGDADGAIALAKGTGDRLEQGM